MTENIKNKKVNHDGEIDLFKVINDIWNKRKTVYKTTAIFFLLGVIIIIGSPKEYRSEVTLLVESGSKSGGGVSTLLQAVGFGGLGSIGGSEVISQDIYPTIVKSTPFLLELINQKVTESKNDSIITIEAFLNYHTRPSFSEKIKKYTLGLPGTIMDLFRNPSHEVVRFKDLVALTPEESKACGELSQRIKVKEGEFANIYLVSVEMQDAFVAAQLTDSVVKSLTKYLVDYRTQKSKKDLEFIEARYTEAKIKYVNTQQNLASYRDQNKNVVLASSKTEEERLQSEFSLASSLYTSLAQQFEQAKIKVQENTPIFKIIEPVKAGDKSKPNTLIIMAVVIFLGGIVGIGIILMKSLYVYILDRK